MSKKHLKCVICGEEYDIDAEKYSCEKCVDVHKNKYGHLIVQSTNDKPADKHAQAETFSTHGNTQLVKLHFLSKKFGLNNLFFKNEMTNPTGSYKDRPSASMVSQALKLDKKIVGCASSGNAAISLSAYSHKAGLECHVFVPKKTSKEKLSMLSMFSANINYVDGLFEDAYIESNSAIAKNGWYNCNAGSNPFSIEGCKTIAYEIFDKIGVPDKIIVPVGDGTNLSGIWKGFKELKSSGAANKTPSMIAVQVKGGDPVTKAFENGKLIEEIDDPVDSIAEGIIAKESYNIIHTVNALRESNGIAVSVKEDEIKQGVIDMIKEGILIEPTSASVIAGLKYLVENELIKKDEKMVCILTGSGFKTLKQIKSIISSQYKESTEE